jgi:diadenosine tetraphosphate (Ap4A) HIT family hydrolase
MKRVTKADALALLAAERGSGCRMCELAREAPPIAASDHAVAVLDRYASRPGHVLVILRRHEERITALGWDEYAALHRIAWDVTRAIDAVLAPRRIYVAALGSAVPLDTSFPHVHLHLVPLTDGGEADRPAGVFTWVNGIYMFDDADDERRLRDQLRAAVDARRALSTPV